MTTRLAHRVDQSFMLLDMQVSRGRGREAITGRDTKRMRGEDKVWVQ